MVCNSCPGVHVHGGKPDPYVFYPVMVLVGFVALLLLTMPGCQGTGVPLSADATIRSGTALALSGGLAYIEATHPDGAGSERDAAARAKAALDATLIPGIDGAATDAVLRSGIDNALTQLGALIPAQAAPFIRIGIDLVLSRVTLPDNPAGKLSPEARAAVSAFLHGCSDGLGAYLGGRAVAAKSVPRGVVRLEWR